MEMQGMGVRFCVCVCVMLRMLLCVQKIGHWCEYVHVTASI
jgi:hypothetical protein